MRGVAAWWWEPVDAQRVRLLHLLIGLFTLVILFDQRAEVVEMVVTDRMFWRPLGLASIFHDPPGESVRWAIWIAALVSAAGWTARVPLSGLVLVPSLWLFGGLRIAQGTMYHDLHLLLLQIMAVSWVGRGAMPSGWPIRLAQIITMLTYFLAGWAKIFARGAEPLRWIEGESLWNHIGHVALSRILFDGQEPNWLVQGVLSIPPEWLTPAAVLTLGLEFLAPLALLNRRLTGVWVLSLWAMHLGIWAMMGIAFPYQTSGLCFLVFLAFVRRINPS